MSEDLPAGGYADKGRLEKLLGHVRAIVAGAAMFDAKTEKRIHRLTDQIWDVSRKSYKLQRAREILAEEESERQRRVAARRLARAVRK